jgi:translocator protein
MKTQNSNYLSLIVWITVLVLIGAIIGSLTKTDVNTWYSSLHRSPLTPPNYFFPVAWTIWYVLLATCGWIIWRTSPVPKLRLIKSLYVMQLLLNWSWTPLFFRDHFTGGSFVSLLIMDIAVAMIMYFSYARMRAVSLLMIPYLGWILFATYLNFYILQYN